MRKIKKPVILLGSGGHAKNIIELLISNNIKIIGISSNDKKSYFEDIKIIGNDDIIDKFKPSEVYLVNTIGLMPKNLNRLDVFKKFRRKGFKFIGFIDPSAIISKNVEIDISAHIMAGVIIRSGVKIGEDSIINTGVILDHDSEVEMGCHLATGVVCSGNVFIKKNSFIGAGTVISNGICIGSNCVIAAGSTIYKDVPNNEKIIQKK